MSIFGAAKSAYFSLIQSQDFLEKKSQREPF